VIARQQECICDLSKANLALTVQLHLLHGQRLRASLIRVQSLRLMRWELRVRVALGTSEAPPAVATHIICKDILVISEFAAQSRDSFSDPFDGVAGAVFSGTGGSCMA
jgi:hypothetical protein